MLRSPMPPARCSTWLNNEQSGAAGAGWLPDAIANKFIELSPLCPIGRRGCITDRHDRHRAKSRWCSQRGGDTRLIEVADPTRGETLRSCRKLRATGGNSGVLNAEQG